MKWPWQSEFVTYNHHGLITWVRRALKGRHREHCLCFSCNHFYPDDRENNCYIADSLFRLCCNYMIVAPVWECHKFVDRKELEEIVSSPFRP